MRPPRSDQWIGAFVANLERLLGDDSNRRDARALAGLRRGLTGHPAERDMWVYGHLSGARPEQEEAAALIASLFAHWHQGGRELPGRPLRSFGGSYGRLRELSSSASVGKNFTALLDSHRDDLPARLRHAVSLLRSKGIAIHWRHLLRDLLQWDAEKRPVQRRWAHDFWKTHDAAANA